VTRELEEEQTPSCDCSGAGLPPTGRQARTRCGHLSSCRQVRYGLRPSTESRSRVPERCCCSTSTPWTFATGDASGDPGRIVDRGWRLPDRRWRACGHDWRRRGRTSMDVRGRRTDASASLRISEAKWNQPAPVVCRRPRPPVVGSELDRLLDDRGRRGGSRLRLDQAADSRHSGIAAWSDGGIAGHRRGRVLKGWTKQGESGEGRRRVRAENLGVVGHCPNLQVRPAAGVIAGEGSDVVLDRAPARVVRLESILEDAIWEVPWPLVFLMGFSQAGYLAPKLTEGSAAAPAPAAPRP